jgi:hypothetical protein
MTQREDLESIQSRPKPISVQSLLSFRTTSYDALLATAHAEEKCAEVLQDQGAAEPEPQTRILLPRFIQKVNATPNQFWQLQKAKSCSKVVSVTDPGSAPVKQFCAHAVTMPSLIAQMTCSHQHA